MLTRSASLRPLWLLLGLGALMAAALASLALGATDIPWRSVGLLLLHPNDGNDSLILHTLRLPRTLVAMMAGVALGVSGLMLQAVTRNPLAGPGILGVEAGGGLAIVLLVVFFPSALGWAFLLAAFVGGVLAAAVTYSAARSVGVTPLRLALAGVAVSSLVSAGNHTLQILFEERAKAALFTLAGSVAGRGWEQVQQVAWPLLVALALSLLWAVKLNLLSLGEDVARSLGTRTERDFALLTALSVLLAAVSVSVVGPIGFVGLVVPHVARGLVGADHRWSLPLCALLGATLMVAADVAARLVARPAETPVGIVVAAIGAPFFVLLARRIGR